MFGEQVARQKTEQGQTKPHICKRVHKILSFASMCDDAHFVCTTYPHLSEGKLMHFVLLIYSRTASIISFIILYIVLGIMFVPPNCRMSALLEMYGQHPHCSLLLTVVIILSKLEDLRSVYCISSHSKRACAIHCSTFAINRILLFSKFVLVSITPKAVPYQCK